MVINVKWPGDSSKYYADTEGSSLICEGYYYYYY